AQPVNLSEAKKVGVNFMKGITSGKYQDYKAKSIFTEEIDDESTLYLMNFKEDGFVIVSANKKAKPVIGYSKEGQIPDNYKQMANFNQWIKSYSRNISDISENSDLKSLENKWESIETKSAQAPANEIAPLVSSTWGQSNGYNAYAPDDVPIGCVATAMSQVMNYFEYPIIGASWHHYEHPEYGVQDAYFDTTHYDWGNMPDNESNDAIAELMYHSAVSVDMNFDPDGSGASDRDVPLALANYFKYKQTMDFVLKDEYSDNEWLLLLKDELDASRPVIYSGSGDGGGHAFVCDGYNSEDLFHFNWGWNGFADGYYEIGDLNPGSNSYNDNNSATIGIEPANGEEAFYFVKKFSGFPYASAYPNYIDGVSEEVAWVVGDDGSGEGNDLKIFSRTEDGGSNWTGGEVDCSATDFSMISGLNRDTAYIAAYGSGSDNSILKTIDGGENWEVILNGAGSNSFFNVVHFFDENNGFVQGDPEGGDFELYTTTDGGDNWDRVDAVNIPDPQTSDEYGIVGNYTAVEDTIWFTTNAGRVYKSDNKGNNWNVYEIYSGEYNTYIDIAFDDGGQNGIAHISLTDGASSQGDLLFKTHDGGETWTEITSAQGNFYTSGITSVPGKSNSFVSVGADYEIPAMGVSYTEDGGETWTDFSKYYKNHQFTSVDFVSPERGYAGGFRDDFKGGMYVFGEPFAKLTAQFVVEDDEGQDTAFCTTDELTFRDQSQGYIDSYNWNFGEGAEPAYANGLGPHTVSYTTKGIKEITLTVEDSARSETFTQTLRMDSLSPSDIDTVTGSRLIDLTHDDEITETYEAPVMENVTYNWDVPNSNIWQGDSDINRIDITFSGAPTTGTFYVEALNGCGVEEYSFEVETIDDTYGIENNDENDIQVYPVPADDYFNIENAQNSIIHIYDIEGRILNTYEITKTVDRIDVPGYEPGLYYLRIHRNNEQVNKKLLIVR
ncbi:MAG: C10 family peptidase, partial [Bacteroidales bacterium]